MQLSTLFYVYLPLSAIASIQPSQSSSLSAACSVVSSTSTLALSASTTSSGTLPSVAFSASSAPSASSASSIVSTASSASAQPSSTPIDPATAADISTLLTRRLSNIVGSLFNATLVPTFLSTLNSSGAWADVDYTTGCAAQRANWPAGIHLNRVATLAGAWHGALRGAETYAQDPDVLKAAKSSLDFWFSNDMTNVACLDQGGTDACPCGTPGLWDQNWFPGIIGIPKVVAQACLLLNSTLTAAELSKCVNITARAYNAFVVPAHQVGVLTGANLLDVASIGVGLGLLTTNVTLITDAYSRVHAATVVVPGPARADGIRPDGSFGQHTGILYNGNYGKDLTNDVVDLEVEAGGTSFQAGAATMSAMATLFTGDRWMIYRNLGTDALHWDFSVLGRFIAFPATDVTQATASILLNLTKIGDIGRAWDSSPITTFSTSLLKNSTSANAGNLVGNKMFFANDYMVQRGAKYVSTLKMVSTRSVNTECTNLANPFGFHLSTGALRTYLHGDEYEDIAASMDWNLIPGITTDYGATPLNCAQTMAVGIESFVGGVSDGSLGVAAFRYTNPLTKALKFQKAYFFMGADVQLVMVSNITSTTNASVISVLDQKRLHGEVVVNSDTHVAASRSAFVQDGATTETLWHDNVGYSFAASPTNAFSLTVNTARKTGNWTAIGTSPSPPTTVDLFSAYLTHQSHNSSLAYTIYPGVNLAAFRKKYKENTAVVVQNDGAVSAAIDRESGTLMAVFWQPNGGTVNFARGSPAALDMSTDGPAVVMLSLKTGVVTVSDPTQTLSSLTVKLSIGIGHMSSPRNSGSITKTLVFTLPNAASGLAGSSVSKNII
ncbi:Polysaccharide lyase family 8 protein [Mycena kentingensis (nom. inval.)]|nr:Polysaccharide lyase family 8 protein [Mycena kentingensis (nom. inval.)]KAF7320464.1 Polysaccharide lyase family 8 protein [Mycena kentingensis (nom. inval.)]